MNDIKLATRYIQKSKKTQERGIEFNLSFTSYKNLMRAKKCYYTGLTLVDEEGAPNQRSIDRIDSSKPYEKGNVVACCRDFNSLKGLMEKDKGLLQSPIFQKAILKMFKEINKRS